MKGITPIISIIILLLITISLAGAAYIFLGNYMTAYTGRQIQLSGVCSGGTQAVVTMTNMGSLPISLGTCNAAAAITARSQTCGDVTILRTDTPAATTPSAGFDVATVAAATPGTLSRALFTDTACTTSGAPRICRYAFMIAGQSTPAEVTVSCSG